MIKQLLVSSTAAARARDLSRVWERSALVALAALALALATINLPYAPRPWFDEGSHLHVPKTLVQHGVYADISSEGFRYFGPTTGVGPTVMLPIAGVFQVGGIGILQGRLVIIGYLLLALVAFYLLARRLYGSRVALLALALVLASRTLGYEGLIEYGRQVLGEVPGMAFLLLGVLAWIKGLQPAKGAAAWRWPILAGLGFGLTLVTKNQFVLIVPPTLALLALLDWRYYKAGSWALRLAPLLIACTCFAVWMLVQLQFLGPGTFATNLALNRKAAGGAIFVFDLDAMLRAIRYLAQVYGGLLVPALLYGLWRCRARTPQALAELAVVLMATLWLCWYPISLGWPRYAFPAVVFGALAVARLIADLCGWLWAAPRLRPAAWLVGLYATAAILVPLALTTRVVFSPDRSVYEMAAYLDSRVSKDVIVETWEPELGVLTDHRYHYPPIELLDPAVRHAWLGGPPVSYDPLNQNPSYIVVGPFGDYTKMYYRDDILNTVFEQETQIGPYALYRIRHVAKNP